MRRRAMLALLALTGPGVSARGQQSARVQPIPQITRVALTARIDYDAALIDGTARLTLRNTSSRAMGRVPLLLNRLMRVDSVRLTSGRRARVNQHVATFSDVRTFQITSAEVALPVPLPPGRDVHLTVSFSGPLVGYTEVGMAYVRDRIDREFTILREDAFAWPVPGVPSLAALRAAPRLPFDYEVTLTVPQGLVVASSGEQVSRIDRGAEVTWTWRSRIAAPWLIVAVAPYRTITTDKLRLFHLPQDSAGARALLDASERAMARLRSIMGDVPWPQALSIIEIPDGWGSQASLAGGIIQEAGAFRDREQFPTVYHELSHLWNAPDRDGPSPRWNEGLAMFLQGRLARELDGWTGEMDALERTAQRLRERCGVPQPCSRVPMRRYGAEGLTDLSYLVGRLMFAALYRTLGEETFDRVLRAHLQSHLATGTTTDDLVQAFVDVGGAPARRIMNEWLESTVWTARLGQGTPLPALFESYRTERE